jgi:tetratricopeptide (TPR) repeat protein
MTNGDDLPADALSEERAGLELMKSGQLELARYKIAMLSKKYPNVAKFRFNYALVLYKLNRYDDALDEINAGLWLKPDDLKATKFKKEIIEMRSKDKAAEVARINEPESTAVARGVVKGGGSTSVENEASPIPVARPATEEKATAPPAPAPVTEPVRADSPEIAAVKPPQPEPVAPAPAQEPQKTPSDSFHAPGAVPEPAGDKQGITSIQPETMPAIRVQSPQPVKPGPEPEVMPAVKVPTLPDEAAKTIEPAVAPTIPEPAPTAERIAEPGPEKAPGAQIPPAESKPEKREENQPIGEPEQSKPEPEEEVAGAPSVEHGNEPEPAIVGVAGPPVVVPSAEPTLVSSIPGPSVVDSTPGEGQQPAPADTIEVEPRVTILEKAADITVEALDTSAPALAEAPKKEVEPEPAKPAPPETREPAPETAASSPRLTNLKDLFKGSRTKVEDAHDSILDTGAVLIDTVELEPGQEPTKKGQTARPGEGELVTFSSFKELESYKFSIQALVEKYLHHKLEHEIPETSDEGTTPVIVEDEATPSQEGIPFNESDLAPHEAASIDDVGSAAGSAVASTAPAEPQPAAATAAVHAGAGSAPGTGVPPETGSVASAAPASAAASVSGGRVNVAGSQPLLLEILAATSGPMPHHLDIDIAKFINSTVMAKARTGKLMQVRGESLAQIVDMETYATLVRMNRAFERNRTSKLNTIKLPFADEAITELEAGVQPVKGYRPDSFLKDETVDVEKQFAQLSSGSQQSLTDEALAKFIAHIKEVGVGQAMSVAGGDDAPLKAEMMKIKRVALDLYNNTQYEQAVLIYSAFTDYFPEDFEALFNLGFCHRELGNYRESETMFKRIVELFYDNAYAWYNLSVIYSLTTEGDKEAYCLQRAREFGYAVDVNRLSRLMVTYTPKNPFDS